MKNVNALVLFLFFMALATVKGQPLSDQLLSDYTYGESLVWPGGKIFQSPPRVALKVNATIRLTNSALTYLRWDPMPDIEYYELRYRPAETTQEWTVIVTDATEEVIRDLPLDSHYEWQVSGIGHLGPIAPGVGVFSTYPQEEPIQVSDELYVDLSNWFSHPDKQIPFCEFMNQLDISVYEKASFVQVYGFSNVPFQLSPDETDLAGWYPIGPSGSGDGCIPYVGGLEKANCGCKVITRGTNLPLPNGGLSPENQVLPRVKQDIAENPGDRTFFDRFEAGPAKYIALRQNENSGGMSYGLSNLQGADAAEAVTTQSAELRFFLGCLRNGGFTTNLPPRCDCERPLRVDYQYTTSLYVKAAKKNCIWSKAAFAQAEDLAFVSVLNEATEEWSILDAGHAMLSRGCNSNWNPDFWIELLNVVKAAGSFYVQTLDSTTTNFPTETQIDETIAAIQTLIGTPFSNRDGDCETINESQVLVSDINNLTLYPNQPIRISLFSSYYAFTKGYGCYRSEASIASDYFLLGVVESPFSSDDECCSDKFASYLAGSLSTPEEGDVQNDAVNSISSLLLSIGATLATFGDWVGLEPLPGSGVLELKREFDLLKGPSCDRVQDDKRLTLVHTPAPVDLVRVYPTISEDQFFVELNLPEPRSVRLFIFDMRGSLIASEDLGNMDTGKHTETLLAYGWPSGTYLAQVAIGKELQNVRLIKQ